MSEAPPQPTDAPVEDDATQPEDAADAQLVHCRHCGQPSDDPHTPDEDWLCSACDRYQDAITCPTCGNLARISLLPEGTAPEPHAPARRRRAKE
jgi:hypothetical protein